MKKLLMLAICGALLVCVACGGESRQAQELQKAPAAKADAQKEKKAILSDETIKFAPKGAQFDIDADGRKEFGDDAAKEIPPEDDVEPVRPSKFKNTVPGDNLTDPPKERPRVQ